MNKKTAFLLFIIIVLGLTLGFSLDNKKDYSKLIRFHVIANSDSEEDQSVKLRIRDEVLKYLSSRGSTLKDRNDYINLLKDELTEVEKISNGILKSEGESYTAKAYLGNFNFPVRQYNDVFIPSGNYTALRIVLGNGEGKNWWCVMFPPLCFIDITRGITTEETEDELDKFLELNDDDTPNESVVKAEEGPKKTVKAGSIPKDSQRGTTIGDNVNKQIKSTNNASEDSHTGSSQNAENNDLKPTFKFKFKIVEIFENAFNKFKSIMAKDL